MRKVVFGIKDENGIYQKQEKLTVAAPPPSMDPDASLDDMSKRIISSLNWATYILQQKIAGGDVSRETIIALKDAHTIIKDLRKDEKEILATLSDEELEKLSKDGSSK